MTTGIILMVFGYSVNNKGHTEINRELIMTQGKSMQMIYGKLNAIESKLGGNDESRVRIETSIEE